MHFLFCLVLFLRRLVLFLRRLVLFLRRLVLFLRLDDLDGLDGLDLDHGEEEGDESKSKDEQAVHHRDRGLEDEELQVGQGMAWSDPSDRADEDLVGHVDEEIIPDGG